MLDKFIYSASLPNFDIRDAASYNLDTVRLIRQKWNHVQNVHFYLKIFTFGIASFFLSKTTTLEELNGRITAYENQSKKMKNAAIKIQHAFLKRSKKNIDRRNIAADMKEHMKPVTNSSLGIGLSVLTTWYKEGKIDLKNGALGQIIWSDTKKLCDMLKTKGFYVFLHAHSYPITLHLELANHLQTLRQSHVVKEELKSTESQRKFRAPGVARSFQNTSQYLQSYLGKSINNGSTMDDNHRETIISCDALPDNEEAYESTSHFFKSNKSIVDTHSSTGMNHSKFDLFFIKDFIKNPKLQKYAVKLFAHARHKLKDLPYGMIRVIAIAKETIQNEKTNYVWRSHAFGRLCTCKHTHGKYGHEEFIASLENHQLGKYKTCSNKSLPQYRILAANLDRDPSKQIYNMDCLNADQKARFNEIYDSLKNQIASLVRLEHIAKCESVDELIQVLNLININDLSNDYQAGIAQILASKKRLLEDHIMALQIKLSPALYNHVTAAAGL